LLTGTPQYFSPELARGGDPGYANDVWALGATLYAAVEGRPPYRQSTNPVAVLHEIATQTPPRSLRAGFLAPVLERMMDPDLATRWSMDDAAHVLRRLADEHRPENTLRSTRPDGVAVVATALEPGHEPEPTRSQPRAEPPTEPTQDPVQPVRREPAPSAGPERRSRGVPVLVGVLAVLAAIAAVLVVRQLSDSGQQPPPATSSKNQKADGQEGAKKDSGGKSGSSAQQADKEQLVRDYYAAAPGGTDEAWAMLGPGMQEQGRERYDAFWRTIKSVDVQSAAVAPGSDSVQVTLVYHTSDGRTSTERKVEGLVESDNGGYLIDSDEPAG
jgi:serine/threonine protein kinase